MNIYRVNIFSQGAPLSICVDVDVLAKNGGHAIILAKAHVFLKTDTSSYLYATVTKMPKLVELTTKNMNGVHLDVVKIVKVNQSCNCIISQYYVEERDEKFTDYVRPDKLKIV